MLLKPLNAMGVLLLLLTSYIMYKPSFTNHLIFFRLISIFNSKGILWKRILLSSVLFLAALSIKSQDLSKDGSVIPPSPNAASLGKYGDIQVGLYTGIPNVSIPLYNVKVGNFTLPISLSYHSAGLKVEEKAGWTGLNWTLNAGGAIVRSVRGSLDERSGSYWYINWSDDYLAADFFRYDAFCRGGTSDMQPDMYYFNFADRSGKFILDSSPTHNARFIPYQSLQVTKDDQLSKLEMWDENGIHYIFEDKETTSMPDVPLSYTSAWYLSKIITPAGEINFAYSGDYSIAEGYSQEEYTQLVGGDCEDKDPINSRFAHEISGLILSQITTPTETITFTPENTRLDNGNSAMLKTITVKDFQGRTVKKFQLTHSYFGKTNSTNRNDVRLKLDKVEEISSDASLTKAYNLLYYNQAQVPSIQSKDQDLWGFYNGAGNTSMLPYVDPKIYGAWVASRTSVHGDRSPHYEKAMVGALQQIVYPTGGTTNFIWEGNDYGAVGGQPLNEIAHISKTLTAQASRSSTTNTPSYTRTFSIQASQTIEVYTTGSYSGNPPFEDGPSISLNLINANGTRTSKLHRVLINSTQKDYPFLETGNYELIATVDGTTQNASATISYFSLGDLIKKKSTGGIRIKQVVNTDPVTGNQEITNYNYTTKEDPDRSSGNLISDLSESSLMRTESQLCQWFVRSSYSNHDMGVTQGSHVGYQMVSEEKIGNENNGKKESYFSNVMPSNTGGQEYRIVENLGSNPSVTPTQRFSTKYMTDYDVFRGYAIKELYYNAQNKIVSEKIIDYNFLEALQPSSPNYFETEVKGGFSFYEVDAHCPCEGGSTGPCPACPPKYNYFFHKSKLIAPWIHQTQATEHSYNIDGSIMNEVITQYFYENPTHAQLTRTTTSTSRGDLLTNSFTYPLDYTLTSYAGTPAVSVKAMQDLHLVSPVIEKQTWRNSVLISAGLTQYKKLSETIVVPDTTLAVNIPIPLTLNSTRVNSQNSFIPVYVNQNGALVRDYKYRVLIQYEIYDALTHPMQMRRASNVPVSYIWGYNKAYPVAEVNNALVNTIAYSGFETPELGNWDTMSGTYSTDIFKTGVQSYKGTLSKAGLPVQNYRIAFWPLNDGSVTINGNVSPVTAGTYFTTKLSNTTSVSINTNSVWIDDIRLHPENAVMSTYTYEPSVGITSATDPNNISTFYEYDDLGRLKLVKDYKGNILKSYQYHFKDPLVSNDHNFVLGNDIQQAGLQTESQVNTAYLSQKLTTYSYADGLGRPVQKISMQQSPGQKDIVQPIVYDAFGRESLKYLPYASSDGTGLFKTDALTSQSQFYQTATNVAHDTPYSETVFESSPLNRVIEQGSSGSSWQPDNTDSYTSTDHTVKHDYALNGANDIILFTYDATTGEVSAGGSVVNYYAVTQLQANKTKDEHGNEVIEYVDKEGHTVCRKVQYGTDTTTATKLYASTYYIYDDLQRLVVVLSPEGVKALVPSAN